MPPTVNAWSIVPLYLETFFDDTSLGIATGFTIERGGRVFLITNKHVVTGRHAQTNAILHPQSAIPNKVRVSFHAEQLGVWIEKTISLENGEGVPAWLSHQNPKVDVVALPIEVSDIHFYHLDTSLADFDMVLEPSETVSIIGFPHGIRTIGKVAVWKTGHIASDLDIDCDGLPLSFIDATTKRGMSGSPVIAKRIGDYRTSTALHNLSGGGVRFLGIYSGRYTDALTNIEVGCVWKPQILEEIFATGTLS